MLKQFILFLTTFSTLLATPLWFKEHKHNSFSQTYYGYGSGQTKQEAHQNALVELSQQLQVTVSSTIKLDTKELNGAFSRSDTSNITTNSSMLLKETKVIQSEKDGSLFYILVQYDYTTPSWFENRLVDAPLFSKVGFGSDVKQNVAIKNAKKDLQVQGIDVANGVKPLKSEKVGKNYFIAVALQQIPTLRCVNSQNFLLSQSSFVQELNKLTQCKHNYKLHHFNNSWYIHYKTIEEKVSQRDFESFFVNVESKKILFQSTKYFLQEGDGFFFRFETTQSGYVSILDVYDDGKVGVILNNYYVKKDHKIIYPSQESNQELTAGLNKPNVATKDMYVALYSPQKIDLSMFEEQTKSVVADDAYKFNTLLKLTQMYEFRTIVLNTKP